MRRRRRWPRPPHGRRFGRAGLRPARAVAGQRIEAPNREAPEANEPTETPVEGREESPDPTTDRRGHEPPQHELLLDDLSDVVYEQVAGGYPQPPVAGRAGSDRERAHPTRPLANPTERSSTLPAGLSTEVLHELSIVNDRVALRLDKEPVVAALPVPSNSPGGYRMVGIESEFLTDWPGGSARPPYVDACPLRSTARR